MSENETLPGFIHAGVQKAGSTWIDTACREHPDIYVPPIEPINYFDVKYYKGEQWYKDLFKGADNEKIIADQSPGYLKNPLAPKRAAELIPDAKILINLRNPVKRAFSQWWNAESYWTDGLFDRCTWHHATHDTFVMPGFYHHHLNRWEAFFPEEQIKVMFFDDFKADNKAFVQEIFEYLGVDSNFEPSVIGEKVIGAPDHIEPKPLKQLRKQGYEIVGEDFTGMNYLEGPVGRLYRKLIKPISRQDYDEGMPPKIQERLEITYRDEMKRLEDKTGRDLSHWFEMIDY
jgi:hypothetical protein